jgi:homoserine dehydrogenase
MPTASAVVADLIDTVVGRAAITFRTLELWSQREARVAARAYDNVRGRYYLRFLVADHPGVLAEIAGVLGRNGVSIASVLQPEADEPPANGSADGRGANIVSLIFMTHTATEGALRQSLADIDRLASVRPGSVRLRVRA